MSSYASRSAGVKLPSLSKIGQRGWAVGLILIVALFAFEIFNFDTTQFALESLLGSITFAGIKWATILAVAFCAIDFAGLTRLFSPDGSRHNKEVWYLMAAWLLGATMNAVMTWWAVSLTLLNNGFGNEVLSREQLLRYVPIFVAVLVWLTRIMFIGSFTIAGDQLFKSSRRRSGSSSTSKSNSTAKRAVPARSAGPKRTASRSTVARSSRAPRPAPKPQSIEPVSAAAPIPTSAHPSSPERNSRVRQRPPMPNSAMRPPSNATSAQRHN